MTMTDTAGQPGSTMQTIPTDECYRLLATHDPEEAMFMADRIALLRDGVLEQLGSPLHCRAP